VSCGTNQKKPPRAKNGVLDLRNWDFEKDGNIRLDGDWEFYWKQFLTSEDFDTVKTKHYISVPKPWNDNKWGKEELGYEGYATYRLRILVNEKIKDFGLKFPDQGTAFELYLNDSLVGKNGKIGKSRETSEPKYKPLLIPFERIGDTITLVCKVSNYDFHFGGIYFAANIGTEENIRNRKSSQRLIDYIISASLIIFFLVLINFYILRPKEKASLLFGIICVITALRTMMVNERIFLDLFSFISWEWQIKLEAIPWLIFPPVIMPYLILLYKKDASKFVTKITIFILGIIIFITIFTPSRINSFLIPFGQLYCGLVVLYTLYLSIKILIKGREGSIMMSIGLTITALSAANEMMYFNNIMPLYLPYPYGMLFFCYSQVTIISIKFSKAFNRIENFAGELKLEVDEKTKDLRKEKEKTEELYQKTEQLLLNVLPEQIAGRLKQGETPIADHFEEASVIFIDIADFTKLSARSKPQDMVNMLNDIFSIFDKIAAKYGLEKIKTIGDCYMAAAGIPTPRKDHAEAVAKMAIESMEEMKGYRVQGIVSGVQGIGSGVSETQNPIPDTQEIQFRIGLDCGPIVAGVIGEQKFIYDLWGDMVNTASRMETHGVIGKIQCTERFKNKLSESYHLEERGEIEIKGKGKMKTFFLMNKENK